MVSSMTILANLPRFTIQDFDSAAEFFAIGAAVVVNVKIEQLIVYLIRRVRGWTERWILSKL